MVEISHWGNIKVDEFFEVHNLAAKIAGEFGRVDYNSYNPNDGKSAIKNFQIDLLPYIKGLYYYDFIGNISSSNAHRDVDQVRFQIQPRFPIFGGWKTDFNIGYNMPTRYHLFQDGERYMFNFTFMHDFKDVVTENYTVKVVFPEGSSDIKLHIPFDIDSKHFETQFQTLDYEGRPTLVIKKKNALTFLNDAHFQVTYTYKSFSIYREYFFSMMVVFSFFLAAIIYGRIDVQIHDKKLKEQ